MNNEWYAHFFEGIVVDVWKDAVAPEQTLLESDFLVQELKLPRGARVLDVPCGYGRHSLELAGRGYRATGVDVSPEMIEKAKQLSAGSKTEVEWLIAEMREISFETAFDGAFCFGNSFGYLNRKGMIQFLAAVARALKPGGRFAFDYGMSAESILPRFTEREWAPVDDLYFLEENYYHVAESCIETTYTFVRNGQVEKRTGLHWVYTVAEIHALLKQAGLTLVDFYGSLQRDPFELGSPVLIGVAERAP